MKYIVQISEDTVTDSGGKLINDLYLQKFDDLDIPKIITRLNNEIITKQGIPCDTRFASGRAVGIFSDKNGSMYASPICKESIKEMPEDHNHPIFIADRDYETNELIDIYNLKLLN